MADGFRFQLDPYQRFYLSPLRHIYHTKLSGLNQRLLSVQYLQISITCRKHCSKLSHLISTGLQNIPQFSLFAVHSMNHACFREPTAEISKQFSRGARNVYFHSTSRSHGSHGVYHGRGVGRICVRVSG